MGMLDGQVAVVTVGAQGIGLAIARRFAAEGAKVLIGDLDQSATEATATEPADIPMGRAGEPGEVAKVALFCASDLSSYMTGTVAEVTGGRLI